MISFDREFLEIARTVRKMQRDVINAANRPEEAKVLRRFQGTEIAQMLGLSEAEMTRWQKSKGFPSGLVRNGRTTYSMEDVVAAHALLDEHYDPAKRSRPVRPEGSSMAVVSVCNFKGGSAKSTQATLFAQHAARAGYRVLVVDLDVQGSTTSIFGVHPSEVDRMLPDGTRDPESLRSISSWIGDRKREGAPKAAASCVVSTYWPNISLVPASGQLHHAEELISLRAKESDPDAPNDAMFYDEIGSFLRRLDAYFDIAVLDCRPDVNMLTTNAIHAATGLIIPVRADMLDVQSFGEFAAYLGSLDSQHRETFDERGLNHAFVKIVPTVYRPQAIAQATVVGVLTAKYPNRMLGAEMVDSSAVTGAGNEKRTIYEWSPASNTRASLARALASADRVNRAIEIEVRRFWGVPLKPVSKPLSAPARETPPTPTVRRTGRTGPARKPTMENAE